MLPATDEDLVNSLLYIGHAEHGLKPPEESAKLEYIKGDIRRSIQQHRTKLDLDQEILHVSHLLRDTAGFPGAVTLSIGWTACGVVLLPQQGKP